MGMKLLSPLRQKDQQQEELTRKILRIQEVEDLTKKTNASLAKAQADFNETLARNRFQWATEEEEHAKRIQEMTKEVTALENRKREALIPIQMYKQEADKIMLEAQDFLKKAKEKDEQADYLTEKLENKLTEVADREYAVSNEEKRLHVARQGLQSQQEATREGVSRLSAEMVAFHEKQVDEETKLDKRKSELALAEINFNAKLEKYARDLEALKIWNKQLKDERAVLDREYKRKK